MKTKYVKSDIIMIGGYKSKFFYMKILNEFNLTFKNTLILCMKICPYSINKNSINNEFTKNNSFGKFLFLLIN